MSDVGFFDVTHHLGGVHSGKYVVGFWDTRRGSFSHRQSGEPKFVAAFKNEDDACAYMDKLNVADYRATS